MQSLGEDNALRLRAHGFARSCKWQMAFCGRRGRKWAVGGVVGCLEVGGSWVVGLKAPSLLFV